MIYKAPAERNCKGQFEKNCKNPNKNGEERQCLICGKSFYNPLSRLLNERGKYCSKKCYYLDRKGRRISIKTEFKKNNLPHKEKCNGYKKTHMWIYRHLGKPSKCEICGKDKLSGHSIHWANKFHTYKKIISDWMRICSKCHYEFDVKNNLKEVRIP